MQIHEKIISETKNPNGTTHRVMTANRINLLYISVTVFIGLIASSLF